MFIKITRVQRIFLIIKKSCLRVTSFQRLFKFTDLLELKMIRIQVCNEKFVEDSNETVSNKKPSSDQTSWDTCVGCQLNSDQALRLLCLKGHVRARDSDSTLRRHQLTRSEWILVH